MRRDGVAEGPRNKPQLEKLLDRGVGVEVVAEDIVGPGKVEEAEVLNNLRENVELAGKKMRD